MFDEINKSWVATVLETNEGKFNPGVQVYEGTEYKGTQVFEYEFFDKRDAWIIAEVLRNSARSIYIQSVQSFMDKQRSRRIR